MTNSAVRTWEALDVASRIQFALASFNIPFDEATQATCYHHRVRTYKHSHCARILYRATVQRYSRNGDTKEASHRSRQGTSLHSVTGTGDEVQDGWYSQLAVYMNEISQRHRWRDLCCMPLLLWSICIWCMQWGQTTDKTLTPNFGMVPVGLYGLYYTSMDAVTGVTWTLTMGLSMWIAASLVVAYVQRSWLLATVVHCWGWYVWYQPREDRWPSFVRWVMLTPLVTWYEMLFALGLCLETQTRIHQQMQDRRR